MKKIVLGIVFLLALGLMVYSCGSDAPGDGGADGMTGVVAYAGPGSVQRITLDNDAGTFTLTKAEDTTGTPTLTVNGTFVRLESGFIKLTVTEVIGTGPTVGAEEYAFEVPGIAFLLKPIGEEGKIMPLVMAGTCPTSDFTANWIKLKNHNDAKADISCNVSDPGAADWFGTFTSETSGVVDLPEKYSLADDYDLCDIPKLQSPAITCSEGIMETEENGVVTARFFLTELGGAIIQTSADKEEESEHILAFPVQEITQANLAGNYFGLVFSGSGGEIYLASAIINTSGTTMTSSKMTDPETGATDPETLTYAFDSVNDPSNGFIKVTGPSSTKMLCQAATNVGPSANKKNIINCVSQDFNDASSYFNILLVSE